jgi:hypothetical protein
MQSVLLGVHLSPSAIIVAHWRARRIDIKPFRPSGWVERIPDDCDDTRLFRSYPVWDGLVLKPRALELYARVERTLLID